MTRDKSVERNNTRLIRLLHTTQEGSIQVGRIIGVTIAAGDDTGVDTSRVAVPDLDVCLWDRLASVDIDDLDVQG